MSDQDGMLSAPNCPGFSWGHRCELCSTEIAALRLRVEELELALRACVEWTTNPQAGAEVWTAARAALTPPPVDQAPR